MATRTAAQSGLWSDTTTWGGTVPGDGDAFNIPAGITVECDVNQSGMATGMAASIIDGKLTFKSDAVTCLKMNGNITGTGELWVGTEENPIQRPAVGSEYRCYLLFNSTGTINVPVIRMYGWYPEREYTQLSADAAKDQNQIVLKEDLGLQQGDMVIIESGTEKGPTVESARGLYTVQSYLTETNTVTLTTNLQTKRLANDYVAIISRPIKIKRSSGTTRFLPTTNQIDNVVNVGVCYDGCALYSANTNGVYVNKDYIFKHCSNRDTYIVNSLINLKAEHITSKDYYPFAYLYDSEITNILGMGSGLLAGYGLNVVLKDSIGFNGSFTAVGLIKNTLFKNIAQIQGQHSTFYIDCTIHADVAVDSISIPIRVLGNKKYVNCVFKDNEVGYFVKSDASCYNCLFEGDKEIRDSSERFPRTLEGIESFDHNQVPGNYKAWCKGGRIETDFDSETVLPGRLILTCESADYPVFRDFPVLLPAYRTSTWQAFTKKSFTGGSVKIELIDPANDPLIDPSAQPLATYSLPDQADTNLPLKLGYKSDKAMQAIIRVSAQNATGTVEIDTRLIENRIQHGR